MCGGNHDAVTALPGQGVATKVDGVAQVDSGGRDLETAFTSPALPSRDFCIQGAESIRVMVRASWQMQTGALTAARQSCHGLHVWHKAWQGAVHLVEING